VHRLDFAMSSLGFLYLDFKTEQGCRDILNIAIQHAPDCQTVVFYFQENNEYLTTAKFDQLANSDLVGWHVLRLLGCLSQISYGI
jgi:hypothetical protein